MLESKKLDKITFDKSCEYARSHSVSFDDHVKRVKARRHEAYVAHEDALVNAWRSLYADAPAGGDPIDHTAISMFPNSGAGYWGNHEPRFERAEYSGDARIWQLGAARDDPDNQDTGETQPPNFSTSGRSTMSLYKHMIETTEAMDLVAKAEAHLERTNEAVGSAEDLVVKAEAHLKKVNNDAAEAILDFLTQG